MPDARHRQHHRPGRRDLDDRGPPDRLGVLALLALVLAGIHDEERHMSLTSAPRNRIGAVTRRLTGVGVRTPEAGRGTDQNPDSSPKAI